MIVGVARRVCFPLPSAPEVEVGPPLRLPHGQAAAFGELLRILACGEESAALAFDRLAENEATATRLALSRIAVDERRHECLLRQLRRATPEPMPDPMLRLALARFFHGLSTGTAGVHFANIAALDSAVCVILGALLAKARPLAREPRAAAILRRIRADEAGHVRLARAMAHALGPPAATRDAAWRTRDALVSLLTRRAAAFDALEVDPVALFARLRRLPEGLAA